MRILALTNIKDFRFFSLIKPLQFLKSDSGILMSEDPEEIKRFNPDIIIHNINGFKFDCLTTYVDLNSLSPFIDLTVNRTIKPEKYFESDMCYFGEALDFGLGILPLLSKYRAKFFCHHPSGGVSYSGALNIDDSYKAYKLSKASLIPPNDSGYRELDIIVADGNPVKFVNNEQFVEDVESAINGKRFTYKSKSDIINNSTNFDRLSDFLKVTRLSKLAKEVRDNKRKCYANISHT